MQLQLRFKEKRFSKTFFKGAERTLEYGRYVVMGHEHYLRVRDLVIGEVTEAQLKGVVDDYLTKIRPEIKDDQTFWSLNVTQKVPLPSDVYMSILPLTGIITAMDRNAITHIYDDKETGSPRFVPLRVGCRLGFDCILRKSNGGFNIYQEITSRIRRKVNHLLDQGIALNLDRTESSKFIQAADAVLKQRSRDEIKSLDDLRRSSVATPGSVLDETGKPAALGLKDAVWNELYSTKMLDQFQSLYNRMRRWGFKRISKPDFYRWLVYPYLDPTDAQLVEAYQRGLVNNLPMLDWWSVYNQYPTPLPFTTAPRFVYATLTQPRAIVELWPGETFQPNVELANGVEMPIWNLPENKVPFSLDGTFTTTYTDINLHPGWRNEPSTEKGVVEIKEAHAPNLSRMPMIGPGDPIAHVVRTPLMLGLKSMDRVARLLTAASDIRPSIVSVDFTAKELSITGDRTLQILVLPETYMNGEMIPYKKSEARFKAIPDRGSEISGTFFETEPLRKELTEGNGFFLEGTSDTGKEDITVTSLMGI